MKKVNQPITCRYCGSLCIVQDKDLIGMRSIHNKAISCIKEDCKSHEKESFVLIVLGEESKGSSLKKMKETSDSMKSLSSIQFEDDFGSNKSSNLLNEINL